MPKNNGYIGIFDTENRVSVETALISIKSTSEMMIDTIDRIVSDNHLNVSKRNGERAKSMVKAACKTVLAYNTDFNLGELETRDQRRILELVGNVVQGKREAIQFQMSPDGDSIKEVFSGEIFKIHEKKRFKNNT